MNAEKILIGWAKQDITPEKPVELQGQFQVRISKSVRDPLYSTVLIFAGEDKKSHAVMVSIDSVAVSDILLADIRKRVSEKISQIKPDSIFINATHTHTAPKQMYSKNRNWHPDTNEFAMPDREINELISSRIAKAIQEAWASLKPGYFAYGIAPAVVGTNRRACYKDGSSIMYGDTSRDDFIHNEGDCDHNVNLLYTYDAAKKLTGMIVNIACPSQVTEGMSEVSADFWHDTRKAVEEEFGDGIYILPQCSAAGDQSPHVEMTPAAHQRMLQYKYPGLETPFAWRKEIANRITNAAKEALPAASQNLIDTAALEHKCMMLDLPYWQLTEQHLQEARQGVKEWEAKLEKLPVNVIDPEYTSAYAHMVYYQRVLDSHEERTSRKAFQTEVHIVRLGPVAFATNRFELLLDFGQRMKARSNAIQTFLVQLTGEGYYLPPTRACNGGYGVTPMNGPVGPEGGDKLVEETVKAINKMFPENENPFAARF